MTHPCSDHITTCDHCALCESGVCCAGLSAQQRSQLLALIEATQRSQRFQAAVAAEAQQTFTLADLMHIEAERQVLGAPLHDGNWSLPVATVADLPEAAIDVPMPADSRKELAYVPVARSSR